jgi:hypothetical protein
MSTAMKRVGDVKAPQLLPILAGLSLLVAGGLLYVTRYMNFFWDEWDLVSYERSWSVHRLLLPHFEHWMTIPILIWKVLFVVVGIGSHVPYEAANLAFHVGAVYLMFKLVRRRSGDLPAFAAALTLLVLGGGGTDIVWAFQIGFTGSVGFGLLAMVLFDEPHPHPIRLIAAAAALTCSLMCSGNGLAFLAAVLVELAADRQRRRSLIALVLPVAAYAEWFLAYGAGLPGSPGAPCATCGPTGLAADFNTVPLGLTYLVSLMGFIAWGAEASASAIFGLPMSGLVLPIVAGLLVLHWFRQGGIKSWQVGLTAGLVAQFALIGLVRAVNGPQAAGHSRYVYVGAVFLLPLVADAATELPWRRLWRPALVAAFALSLAGSVLQLRDRALVESVPGIHPMASQVELMQIEDAELQTVEVFRGAPDMNLNRGLDDAIMPQLNAGPYLAAVRELGSPVPHSTLDALRRLPPRAVDTVMVNLFGGAVTITPDANRSTAGLPCQTVDSTSGATMDLQVPSAESVMLKSARGGEALLFLGFVEPPTSRPLQRVMLQPAAPEWIYLPNTGKPTTWRLQVETIPMGMIEVCGNGTLQVSHRGGVYRAKAETGQLGPLWSPVSDPSASNGRAAKAASGTAATYKTNLFGNFAPLPGKYDVWYRVRARSAAGTTPEMVLGLWDGESKDGWVASTAYSPNQVGTGYQWLKVATRISPNPAHNLQFMAAATPRAGTDWYVDQAVMVPSGSDAPAA